MRLLVQSLSMQRRRARVCGVRVFRSFDRGRRARRSACWALALAGLAFAGEAAASEAVEEIERWVPSFSLYFDALGQKASGSATSGNVLGPPLPSGCGGTGGGSLCPGSNLKLRPDSASSDTDVAPLVGASLELMTPRLFDAALRPRLFAHGDAAASFGFERNLAGEASPGTFLVPPPREADNDVEEVTVKGQGSRARAQVRRLVLSAGGGVAFSLDLFERRVRIKPSFEYLREEIDLIGGLRRVVKLSAPVDPRGPSPLEGFRLVVLKASAKKRLDAIGPGLEIEADTLRMGPFLLSIYAAGRGYHFFGNLDDTLTATNEFGETATWTFEKERWAWRAGVGLRFRLIPE
jgi:hypothetical protein